VLSLAKRGRAAADVVLGPDPLGEGMTPQAVVPASWWQAARTTGEWTLVGCTVSPGFTFESFVLAPSGFDIPRGG
jgi:predicted cupin superfamily sugar epimerase